MNLKVGDLYPVWWDTFDERPAGDHLALVMEIKPYTGRYTQWFTHILRLAAPRTNRGWLEMSVNLNEPVRHHQ